MAVACVGYTFSSHSPVVLASSTNSKHHDGVIVRADGVLHLRADAPVPPAIDDGYSRYGLYIAPVEPLPSPTTRLKVIYDASLPVGSALRIAIRGSTDGQHWTPWETDVEPETTVQLPYAVHMAQYRAILLGTDTATPVLRSVKLQPVVSANQSDRSTQQISGATTSPYGINTTSPNRAVNQQPQDQVAPTFRIRGTRMGMVGGRTANGHIIRPHDHFVSLPSWRSLSSRGGHEYQVRITYNGRSAVAPVWDVGPWNTRDDYWSVDRERFKELRQGWPQDHAAYYDGHNGGYAEKGRVRFPTAIDVGDGVWWNALGIVGDQAEVEVTFLWLGRDPLAEPPPPPATEVTVDDEGPAFHLSPSIWYHSPLDCGANGHAFWTLSTDNPDESTNSAQWQPTLTAETMYDVYAHVPICSSEYPVTQHARYVVQHRDGTQEVTVNQAQQTGWVLLGQFPFASGDNGVVKLTDVAGDTLHTIWFDDIKWVPASEDQLPG